MTATRRALAGILTLVLAACSSAHESTSTTGPAPTSASTAPIPSSPTSTAGTAAPTTVTTAGAAASSEPASPLAAFFGNAVSGSGSTFDEAAFQRGMEAFEGAIASCMKEQGFDYIPYSPAFQFRFQPEGLGMVSAAGDQPSIPDDQYAKQYGYGISTIDTSTDTSQVNPNDAIRDAMSPAERVAYYHALYGPKVALQKDGTPAHKELDIDDASCFHQADVETSGDQTAVTPNPALDAFAPLRDEMGALTQRELADPRMVTALQAWTDCLAAAGYPGYTDLNAPRQDVSDRTTALMGQARDPSKADSDKLAELRAFEIGVATADFQCRVPYDAAFLTVSVEVEQAFIDEHRAELEQYRDALAASSTGG